MQKKEKKINIFFFTANRAEYGLIFPFIKKLSKNKKFNIHLIVSGSHLDKNLGYSFNEIKLDKILKIQKINVPLKTNSSLDASNYFNLIQKKTNQIFKNKKIDIVFLSSDRFETFAFAISSYLNKIPIAHYEGGDITEGGTLDDNIRHAISKIANIHFTTNNDSKLRLIKMGEEKWRCFNFGYSPMYEIKNRKLNIQNVVKKFNINKKKPLILFTYHPIDSKNIKFKYELDQTFLSLRDLSKKDFQIIITYPNFDPGYKDIIRKIKKLKDKSSNIKIVKHLGRENYHNLLNYIGKSNFGICLGNSSSGIKEAVFFKCPTINIGERQKSRLKPDNVIDVRPNRKEIVLSVLRNLKVKKKIYNPYKVTPLFNNFSEILYKSLKKKNLLLKKNTY